MNKVNHRFLAGLLVTVGLVAFLVGSTRQQVLAATAYDLGCQSVQTSGVVTSYWGCTFGSVRDGAAISSAQAEADARTFLATHADVLTFDSGHVAEMALVEVKHGLGTTHTRLEQVFNGYPVFGGSLTVNQGPTGQVQSLHSSYVSELEAGVVSAERSAATAEMLAMQAINALALRHPSPSRLVWFPHKTQAILAWEITVYSAYPLGDFLTVVDAQSGDILFQENRIAFDDGSGQIYHPNPHQTQGSGTNLNDSNDADSTTLSNQRINVTLNRLDSGTGLLVGEWVSLTLGGGESVAVANETSRIYNYTRNDPRFEQVVIYHTVDQIAAWFHELGFDDDTGTPNGIRDFPSLANAHWNDADQSFYSTGDDAIHFGDGGVDDGEDGDIVAHEYGHAIQFNQNANWGGGEMGAMGEGFGDYLAASFFVDDGVAAYQAANAACVGEWDASSYDNNTPPCLRRVDGNKTYPDDLVDQVHADGEIWSRALWDIHGDLGRDTTMQLVLQHHFALPASATMPTAALAMIEADVNLNGGANDAALREAFCDRGILSGENCTPSAPQAALSVRAVSWSDAGGNNNGFPDPGETISVMVELENGGSADATAINSTLASTGAGASIGSNTSAYPDLAVSDSGTNIIAFTATVDPATCGNTLEFEFVASYNNSVANNASLTHPFTIAVGEFTGTTSTHAWSGSLAIPDNNSVGVSQSISVPSGEAISDLDVNITAAHSWVGDLAFTLAHPNGTSVMLIDRAGFPAGDYGCSEPNIDVTLDDEAAEPVESACSSTAPAIGGSLMPENALSAFDGEFAEGDWVLTVSDNVGVDTGTVTAFSLDITTGGYTCQAVTPTAVSTSAIGTRPPVRDVLLLLTVLLSLCAYVSHRRIHRL